MTFYNGMIRASFDWFKKSTKDLLFQPTVEALEVIMLLSETLVI